MAESALPFFKLLRRSGPFSWTEEAEQSFQELKQHLTSLPVLVAPEPGEPLFLYLAASAEAVSMVLVAERTEQARQGNTRVLPAKDGERTPDTGARQPHPSLKVRTPHKRVRRSLVPVGTQNRWGPKGLMWWTRASRTQ